MTSMQDNDGYKVYYDYDAPGRVVKVRECHSTVFGEAAAPGTDGQITGNSGQTYSIRYDADNTTTFHFSGVDDKFNTTDDIENVYVFDEQGRTLCVYSKNINETKVIGARVQDYEEDSDNASGSRNKIKDSAVVGMHTNNLLQNHSFEYNDSTWTLYKSGGTPESGALNAYSTVKKYIGNRGAYVNLAKRNGGTAGFSRTASLQAGTYTFSAYCSTSNIANASAYLKVTDDSCRNRCG